MSDMRDRSAEVEVVAAVLLVDLGSMRVVHTNQRGLSMLPQGRLPAPLDAWGDDAGLVGADGRPLSAAVLASLARGETGRGIMVQRRGGPDREDASGARVLWLTGFPLTSTDEVPAAAADGRARSGGSTALRERALLVLIEVSGAAPDLADHGVADMHNRAVVAIDLSFTISDPRAADGPIVWVNPAFEATTGYRAEEVIGRNYRFLQGPDTDREAVARIRAAIAAAEPIRETLLNYRADGTAFWNQLSIAPVLDADGTLVNFVGVQSDVTTRVDAERSRELALASERRARSRLALLADVGEAMTQIEPRHALQRLVEVLARAGSWCAALEVDDEVTVAAASGISLGRGGRYRLLAPGGSAPDPVRDLATGAVHGLLELAAPQTYPEGSLSRWLAAQLAAEGTPGPWTVLPTPGRRDVLGLIVLGVAHLPLDHEESDLLLEVARRAGLSLDNARLYAREHLVVETLQRSMLPEVDRVPGLDIWSFYAPGTQHAQVGGAWYDVMRLDDDTVGLVIGDVVGHDIEAASAMGQLRSVVRACSADGDDPGAVLMRVDQLVGGMRVTRSASLVYANLVDDGAGSWEMSWSRAGHLPPIVVHDGRATALMGAGGPMVGLMIARRESDEQLLVPGDVLVLCTDGLIERRARPMRTGFERLLQICSDLDVNDAAGIGERLLAELGEEPEDDIALVVLRVPVPGEPVEAGSGNRSRRWQLPGEASSIPRARARTTQVCQLWGLTQGRHAELVVSELVANAVLHGHGTVTLHLRESEARALRIEVGDANPTPPRRVDGHRDRTGGYGLTVVGTVAQWGWRPESTGKVVWAVVPSEQG